MGKSYTYQDVEKAAHNIRKNVLKLTLERNGCYLAQACSSAEILATLYMKVLHFSKSKAPMQPGLFPGAPSRENMEYLQGAAYHGDLGAGYDRLFISPAHYAAPVYAALIECGRLAEDALDKFNRDGYAMEMIGANHTPGFETAAGTLAQAISTAGGTAHSRKLKNEDGRVFVFMSDGELQEGQLWEAIQALSFYKLDNFVLFVDVNGQQVEGLTKDVMNIEPIDKRFEAFGAKVITINGHDVKEIKKATTKGEKDKPLVILCKTSGTTDIPLLEEKKPYLHFIRLKTGEEYDKYKEFYDKYSFVKGE